MTESTEGDRPNMEQIHAGFMARRIRKAADQLRDLAEALDRAASSAGHVGEKGWPSRYANIANEVQHEVLWGVANLHIDGLSTDAADAESARTTRLVAEKIAADIETTIGGYPGNEAERPKVDVGEFANDAQWAARIARKHSEQ